MDKKTIEALEAIEKIKKSDDIVYEIARKEKKSGLFHFMDFWVEGILSTGNSLMKDKVMYLIASEDNGKIVEIENGKIINTLEVPDWKSEMKETFKKVVIDDYVYKKFRRIS